jgi:hypothetical protein
MAQELRRDQAVRLPNPSAQPFVAALKTCRFFAVLFFWVTMVCVVAYAAAFVTTEWIGLYDVPKAEAASKPAAEPAPSPAAPAAPVAPATPAAPAASAAAPAPAAGASWLSIFENTASAAPAPPNGKSAPSKDSEETPGTTPTFFGVPATPAGAASAKEAPKAAAVEAPKKATAAVEALKEASEAVAAAKDAETKGEAVAKPEMPVAAEKPALSPEQKAQYYYNVTVNILKPLRVVGVLSSFLLGMTLFLYLQIALLGRLAGIKQLTTALFFLLLFFATVVPWENIFEGFRVNVFYDFTRLVAIHAQRLAGDTGDFWEQAKYFARFFGLPLVSIALLAWSGLQFASGYAESVVANE